MAAQKEKTVELALQERSPFDILFGQWSLDRSPGYLALETLSRLFTPYDFNPLDINPLRDIVAAQVDFDCINHRSALKLFITATNVRTGRLKIFRQPGITVDKLMASACLPSLFKAIEIDGQAYRFPLRGEPESGASARRRSPALQDGEQLMIGARSPIRIGGVEAMSGYTFEAHLGSGHLGSGFKIITG